MRLEFGSVVEWLKHWTDDQHSLGSKPTCAILLCPWERHFTALFPAWWSWQAVLNYSHISIKLLADSNILTSPEAGRGNCLPYVQRLRRFPASQDDKYREKKKTHTLSDHHHADSHNFYQGRLCYYFNKRGDNFKYIFFPTCGLWGSTKQHILFN